MNFFGGDIAEAVRISKEKNVIFLVLVVGQNDESTAMTELLNNASIDPARYLAVRIDSNTDTYKQFAQIYHLVPVPSIFFIGQGGQPIEIVAANVQTVEALQERIAVAEGIFYGKAQAQPDVVPSNSAAAPSGPANVPSVPVKAPAKPAVEKKAQPSTMDEKKAKEDLEMQKMKEERKREKAQDEEARRRVLEQIKLDRLRRQDQEPITVPAKSTTPSAPAPVRTLPDSTRIQFRKPSGETFVDTFKSDGPFGDVWKYAKASVDIKDFVLATAMPPRKVYSAEHSESTLIELNLAPSAVLLVIPLTKPSLIGEKIANNGGVVATVSNFVITVFWTLMTPIMAVWNRIRGTEQPSRPDPSPEPAGDEEPGPNIGSEILQKRNLSRYNLGPAPGSSGGAQTPAASTSGQPKKNNSNIHRLKDYDSDDNENNTYNGNSTEQM